MNGITNSGATLTKKHKIDGKHAHKDGGHLTVTKTADDEYEIVWPDPHGRDDGSHGGKMICNEAAALAYLERDTA